MAFVVELPANRGGVTRTVTLPRSSNVTINQMFSGSEMDTEGRLVPVNAGHTFTYDGNGNLKTDTVSDATGAWVRTYTYTGGVQSADSGWVKQ